MSSEQMTKIDNFWLNMDQPDNLMMITFVLEFDEVLDFGRLSDTIEERWCSFNRFRETVKRTAFGPPIWNMDINFDIRSHLHRIALPEPGDKATLQEMISDLTSVPLDPTKPLWQVYLIENFGKGCVLFWKIHHCIADGMALTHALLGTTDKDPDGLHPAIKFEKKGEKKIEKKAGISSFSLQKLKDIGKNITSVATVIGKKVFLKPDSQTVLKGKIGIRKCVAWSEPLSLKELKSVCKDAEVTLNDMLVTALTGSLREYLKKRKNNVLDINLRVMMPVNIRKPGLESELGNKFGIVSLDLPVNIEDRILRLKEVKRRNDDIKGSPEAFLSFHALSAVGIASNNIIKKAANFFANKGSAVLSNVPGPRESIYLAGKKIKNMMFWVPRTGNVGMGISILSYDGKVTLGLATDESLVSDPETILECFGEELKSMVQVLKNQIQYVKEESDKNSISFFNSINENIIKVSKLSSLGIKSISLETLAKKYTNDHSKFIEINGTNVHYCDEGTGPTLLLLHGIMSSLHTWNEWVKELSPYYRLVRLDLPGFGLTGPFTSQNYSRDTYMDFLHQFIERLNLKKIAIAGNSVGGYIAWNYAVLNPEKITKLILIDSVGYPQDVPNIINFLEFPGMGKLASFMTPRIFIDRNVRGVYGDKSKVTDSLIDQYFEMIMRPGNRKAYVEIFHLLKSECTSDKLCSGVTEVKSPTLIMWGKEDRWVPVDVVKRWEQDLQLSKTIIYDGVGHMPMEEIPLQTAHDAHSFLKCN
ncbi:MAG: wax ester/triacylglycerol synthase family O-acyltransferase [Desulfobacterales bacterium]|nr:wax ester/triacylglycerol synthase family O-acyltransferase [Desulfobacterales bacterium]